LSRAAVPVLSARITRLPAAVFLIARPFLRRNRRRCCERFQRQREIRIPGDRRVDENVAMLAVQIYAIVGRNDDVVLRQRVLNLNIRHDRSASGRVGPQPIDVKIRRIEQQDAVLPFGADVLTLPVKFSWPWLDVSTNPPLPNSRPPSARIVPASSLSDRPQDHLAAVAAIRRRGVDSSPGVDC
jgi:hypothetical protein